MSPGETERLVDEYLKRLEAAAAHLQRSRRAELIGEIREHIEMALRQEDAASEVAVRNVLERLGPPEEIVEAAEPPAPAGRSGRLEIAALLALLVPFLGWLVGSVLVVASQAWSRRDKLVGLTLLVLIIVLPLLGVVAESSGSVDSVPPGETGPAGLKESDREGPGGFVFLLFLIGLPSALYLGWRLRRHPRA